MGIVCLESTLKTQSPVPVSNLSSHLESLDCSQFPFVKNLRKGLGHLQSPFQLVQELGCFTDSFSGFSLSATLVQGGSVFGSGVKTLFSRSFHSSREINSKQIV